MEGLRRIPITFYTKPGCHLCEDVADQLEALELHSPLDITVIDITTDLDVHRRYWDKIPVVDVGGRIVQAPIDATMLRSVVMQAAEAAEHPL